MEEKVEGGEKRVRLKAQVQENDNYSQRMNQGGTQRLQVQAGKYNRRHFRG